jgi:hypothetical protein
MGCRSASSGPIRFYFFVKKKKKKKKNGLSFTYHAMAVSSATKQNPWLLSIMKHTFLLFFVFIQASYVMQRSAYMHAIHLTSKILNKYLKS